ncbi:MAG: alpha-N-arabinofuranosidase, partial [Leadbetterella sp.]|nr:alpha-N-arabinofuranosidase [Leadbetterella sp.]
MPEDRIDPIDFDDLNQRALSAPLVKHMYTADPSAHVFKGRIYIYPSHDVDGGEAFDDLGGHFGMEDYHVFSMDKPGGEVTDHGPALHVNDVPWAEKRMWDARCRRKRREILPVFPAKGYDGIFKTGVAIGDAPTGPFTPQPEAIKGSFSIDPAVFKD